MNQDICIGIASAYIAAAGMTYFAGMTYTPGANMFLGVFFLALAIILRERKQ